MMTVLTILIGILDPATGACAIARWWRLTLALLIFTSVMVFICAIWGSTAIRWIGGFHLFVVFLTTGLLWETYRGQLRDK
ncbi:MAG: hypothetical protein U1F61_31075 [Opitutaceae bacterium]